MAPVKQTADEKFMRQALSVARRGIGNTWPNPSVGCVLVKGSTIVGRGWTAPGGRPHAETIALEKAGSEARGSFAYVTLEPCCHHGKTPPCTDALVKAGVVRVVIATIDPDERMAGNGIEALKRNGVEVVTGVLQKEAEEINSGFFSRLRRGRPFITLKIATSLDGKIALKNKESKWITGPQARSYAHILRARNNAIMVGIGTVLADNPELSCRLPGLEDRSPVRVVLDSNLKIPLKSNLVQTAREIPVWVITLAASRKSKNYEALQKAGVRIIEAKEKSGQIGLQSALKELAELGINRVLVEGGGQISTSLLKENLVDEMIVIQAPKIIGDDGVSAINDMDINDMGRVLKFNIAEEFKIADDSVKIMRKI